MKNRIEQVEIKDFRGFNGEHPPINTNSKFVLLFGPNGFGKTSFFDAVEWLFTGVIRRFENIMSKEERNREKNILLNKYSTESSGFVK